jgi:hypothetical protein
MKTAGSWKELKAMVDEGTGEFLIMNPAMVRKIKIVSRAKNLVRNLRGLHTAIGVESGTLAIIATLAVMTVPTALVLYSLYRDYNVYLEVDLYGKFKTRVHCTRRRKQESARPDGDESE